ncbi:MAG TPA: hypothetical protein PLO61_11370, partial [Fimbriimonadaceae bacterium]|nr:hypothetical protein [Fimbriimonadaceae bacterium]HRJ34280.1 hypothetical protein [Fimbriimonadaceae bacterium]
MIKIHQFARPMAVLAGALVVGSAYSVVQDSVTFGPFSPAIGTSTAVTSGTLFTNVFTVTGYTLGRIDYSGNTVEINGTTNDFVNDTFMRVTYPGGTPFSQKNISTITSYTGTVTFSGLMFVNAGAIAPFGGGTWQFHFVNRIDDAPTGQLDNTMNITFNLTDEPLVDPTPIATYNPLADGVTTDAQTYTAGQVNWYKIVLPTGTSQTRYLDLDTETSTTATALTALAIWNTAGAVIAFDTVDGSGSLSQLTFGATANPRPRFTTGANTISQLYTGRDGNLAAGTYYVSVTRTTATYGDGYSATSTSTGTASITFRASYNTASGIPDAVDLGTLSVGSVTQTFTNIPFEVKWYKFTLDAPVNLSRFLDIHQPSVNQNYDYVLFDNSGNPLNYVNGPSTPGANSPYFSFGGQDNIRAAASNTRAFAGHDGNLAAGTYWLAVARVGLTIAAPFNVTTTSTVTVANVPVQFTLGDVTPPAVLYAQRLSSISQFPWLGTGASTFYGILSGTDNYDRQLADDFTISDPGGWTVSTVEGQFTRATETVFPTNVRVTFFQNSGGVPGTQVASEVVPWASVTNVDGGIFGTANVLSRYRVPITPVNLASGSYFVSIQPYSPGPTTTANSFWFSSTPNSPVVGAPFAYRKGPDTSGALDATWPTDWTASGSGVFSVPHDLTMRLEGTVNAPSNVVSGTVDFGQLTAAYNTGANLPTSIPVSFRDGGNSEIATGSATYDPVTGAFSASVPGAVTVPYR